MALVLKELILRSKGEASVMLILSSSESRQSRETCDQKKYHGRVSCHLTKHSSRQTRDSMVLGLNEQDPSRNSTLSTSRASVDQADAELDAAGSCH